MAQNIQSSDLCIVCNTANLEKRKNRCNPARKPRKYTVSQSTLKQRERLEEDFIILPQLRPLFLLKEIFKRSMEDGCDLLKRMGNPSEWFEVCDPCSNRIDQAIEIQVKMRKLGERLKKIKEDLCEKLHTSHLQEMYLLNDMDVETPDVQEEKTAFRTELRRMIPEVLARVAFEATTTMDVPRPEVKTEEIQSDNEPVEPDDESYFEAEMGNVIDSESPVAAEAFVHHLNSDLVHTDIEISHPSIALEDQPLLHTSAERNDEPRHPGIKIEETSDNIINTHCNVTTSSNGDNRQLKKLKKLVHVTTRILPDRTKTFKITKKHMRIPPKRKRKPYYYVPITKVAKKPDAPLYSESQKFKEYEKVGRDLAKHSKPTDESDVPTSIPGRPLLRKRKPVKRKIYLEDEDDDELPRGHRNFRTNDELDTDFTIKGDEDEDEEDDELDADFTVEGDEDEDEEDDYTGDDYERNEIFQMKRRQKSGTLKFGLERAKQLLRKCSQPTILPQGQGWKRLLDCADELLDMSLITYPPTTAEERSKIPKKVFKREVGVRKEENGEKPFATEFRCPSCGKYFINKYFVISHIHRFHLGIRKHWRCNICSRKFVDARHVLTHLKLHDAGLLLTCPLCNAYSCTSQEEIDIHIACHQKDVPNPECERCGTHYKDFKSYLNHMSAQHGFKFKSYSKESFVCELCSKTFAKERSLKYHQVTSHGHVDDEGLFPVCPQCGKLYQSAHHLEVHVQRDHVKAKDFFCDQCGLGFALDSQLKQHVNYHHNEAVPITCHVCGLVKSNKNIQKHMSDHHPETINMSVEELEAHVKKLNEEKPHKCKLCGESFAFSVFLYHHHRNEHKEVTDKYKCDVCGKGYSRACSVKRHYETVHEKKTTMCQYCSKEYPISSMYQHQRQHKACNDKRLAELESRKPPVVENEGPSTSSAITPFLNPFRYDEQHGSLQIQQQFETLNPPVTPPFATQENRSWEEVPCSQVS